LIKLILCPDGDKTNHFDAIHQQKILEKQTKPKRELYPAVFVEISSVRLDGIKSANSFL